MANLKKAITLESLQKVLKTKAGRKILRDYIPLATKGTKHVWHNTRIKKDPTIPTKIF